MVEIVMSWVDGADQAVGLPAYQTEGAAGADLRVQLAGGSIAIAPGERRALPTGLRMAIPAGYEVQIRPRSGLALRHGLTMVNAPGTIDSDYRGEVQVLVVNLGDAPVELRHGDRVAQMVVAPVVQARFSLGNMDDTARGAGGFGSTGVSA